MLLSMGINESVDLSNIAQYLDGTTDVTRTLVGQGTSTSIDAFQRSSCAHSTSVHLTRSKSAHSPEW